MKHARQLLAMLLLMAMLLASAPVSAEVVQRGEFKTKFGIVHALSRTDDHFATVPFRIELRADCGSKGTKWHRLKVLETINVCRPVTDAFVIDPQTDEIHVSFHAFDADEYNRRSLISTEDLKIICQKRPTITSFKLADLCR